LLTVLIALMIITIMLFEFQFSSMVERKLAYNELNQLQAYYLAKSGARIGMLRVALYGRAVRDSSLKNMAKGIDLGSYLNQIWSLPLPPFPPEGGASLKKLDKADRDAAEKFLKQTKITGGQSSHVITNESSKINLNYLVVPKEQRGERIDFRSSDVKGLFEYVGRTLMSLMDNFLKESKDPFQEYGNLRPEEVVYDIMDWVTPGSQSYAQGSKDSFYEQQKPPYKAKRNRLYTLDELRMVRTITPHLYDRLRPYVTVFSYDGKININEASDTTLKALYPDFTEDDLKKLNEEKAKRGGFWATEASFVKYITDSLGRAGFSTLYKDDKNYPFTVSSQSFLVESLGQIQKSGSSIQKVIRVAMAMSGAGGGGGQSLKNIATEAQCTQTPGAFWDRRVTGQDCKTKPATEQACKDIVGSWQQQNGQDCCQINNVGFVCLSPQEKQTSKEANKLKVLYWAES